MNLATEDLTKDVRDENAVELGFFEEFGQVHPVLNVIELVGLILRMSP